MWSYYGSKSKIVAYYPNSKYGTIIEPFAGTAQYSLYGNNWKKKVILYDKYPIIINVWKYLINANPEKILALPNIEDGATVDNYNLTTDEKHLIGFCINRGSAQPKKSPAKFNNWNENKQRIAMDLHKIKHWKVFHGSYEDAPDVEATWFIDPPYQFAGKWYHSSVSNKSINYPLLGGFCKTRRGQVIVCENIEANWLSFKPLTSFYGQLHNRTEAIWLNTNNDTLTPFLPQK